MRGSSVVPEGRRGCGCGFQRQAEFIAVQEIGDVFQLTEAERLAKAHGSHETARATPGIDEPLVPEALQRLPDDRPGYLELRRQLMLRRQTLVRLVGAGLDRAVHPFEHDVGQALAGVPSCSPIVYLASPIICLAMSLNVSGPPKPPDLVMI